MGKNLFIGILVMAFVAISIGSDLCRCTGSCASSVSKNTHAAMPCHRSNKTVKLCNEKHHDYCSLHGAQANAIANSLRYETPKLSAIKMHPVELRVRNDFRIDQNNFEDSLNDIKSFLKTSIQTSLYSPNAPPA